MVNLIYGWIPKPGTVKRGSGKTGGWVWMAHQRKLAGRKVITNMDSVSFQDDMIRANELKTMPAEKLFKAVLGNTEVHTFMESRRTQKSDQISISYVISQLRKLRVEYHWDSQADEKVERRLVQETDIIVHCDNLGCRDIDCRDQSCRIDTCGIFQYDFWDKHNARFLQTIYLNGPRDFYNLFDSEEITADFTGDEGE